MLKAISCRIELNCSTGSFLTCLKSNVATPFPKMNNANISEKELVSEISEVMATANDLTLKWLHETSGAYQALYDENVTEALCQLKALCFNGKRNASKVQDLKTLREFQKIADDILKHLLQISRDNFASHHGEIHRILKEQRATVKKAFESYEKIDDEDVASSEMPAVDGDSSDLRDVEEEFDEKSSSISECFDTQDEESSSTECPDEEVEEDAEETTSGIETPDCSATDEEEQVGEKQFESSEQSSNEEQEQKIEALLADKAYQENAMIDEQENQILREEESEEEWEIIDKERETLAKNWQRFGKRLLVLMVPLAMTGITYSNPWLWDYINYVNEVIYGLADVDSYF